MAIAIEQGRWGGKRPGYGAVPTFGSYAGDDEGLIVVSGDDPLQSLAAAVRERLPRRGGRTGGTTPAGAKTPAPVEAPPQLFAPPQPAVDMPSHPAEAAGPLLGSDVPLVGGGRIAAREAWSAVVILMIFIVAGIAWTSAELHRRGEQTAKLTLQLDEKQTAITSYQQQIKQLRWDLAQAEGKLRARVK